MLRVAGCPAAAPGGGGTRRGHTSQQQNRQSVSAAYTARKRSERPSQHGQGRRPPRRGRQRGQCMTPPPMIGCSTRAREHAVRNWPCLTSSGWRQQHGGPSHQGCTHAHNAKSTHTHTHNRSHWGGYTPTNVVPHRHHLYPQACKHAKRGGCAQGSKACSRRSQG